MIACGVVLNGDGVVTGMTSASGGLSTHMTFDTTISSTPISL